MNKLTHDLLVRLFEDNRIRIYQNSKEKWKLSMIPKNFMI